jgi:hypothetical protein
MNKKTIDQINIQLSESIRNLLEVNKLMEQVKEQLKKEKPTN